jgi:hypothetical protein
MYVLNEYTLLTSKLTFANIRSIRSTFGVSHSIKSDMRNRQLF